MRFKLGLATGVSGFGSEVHKLVDAQTDELLGYVGVMEGKEVIHFVKPITVSRLIHISNYLNERQTSLRSLKV